ncbi:hypothetical protein M3Y99_00090500 [Aphelenchoides fujianensis]|nr:hypothetical protein M3Y99_00090500 [Aphelenchoides fujianensis]
MVACQPTVTQQQPWDKTNLHIVHYSLWEIVVGACTFIWAFCPPLDWRRPPSFLIAGFELLHFAVNRPLSNFRRTIRDHLLTVVTLVFAGYGFTPIIRTLTTSISTDTIYATAIFVFPLQPRLPRLRGRCFDSERPAFGQSLCLAASVFLISRVENDLDAFLLLSLALGLFSFWPQLRNRVFDEVEASPRRPPRPSLLPLRPTEKMDERGPAAKRFRRNDDPTNPNPSKVVHVRNLNADTCEADLIDALSEFGPVAYVVSMPTKNMALVEFEQLEAARQLVAVSQHSQIYVGETAALFNYSTSPIIQRTGLETERPNHVLIVTVYRLKYPINVRVLHKAYANSGKVLRIAILRQNGVQGLIEFEDVETARKAKHDTNGAEIYPECNTLKVEFAKVDGVKVTANNLDQWDFVGADENFSIPPAVPPDHPPGRAPHRPVEAGGFADDYEPQYPPKRHDSDFDCERLFNLLSCYGNPLKIKFMHSKQDTCMVEMGNLVEAQNVMRYLQGAQPDVRHDALHPPVQAAQPKDIGGESHEMQNGTPSFVDFTGNRNLRFTNPATASRNRIVYPTAQLHFFNVPLSFNEDQIMRGAHSLSGLLTFDDTERATEALMLYNHAPIDDRVGDGPYVLKLTYSGNKTTEYRGPY